MNVTLSGTLLKDKTGFTLTTNGVNAYDSKTLLAALPNGTVNSVVQRPSDRTSFLARVESRVVEVTYAARILSTQRQHARESRRRRLRSPVARLLA